MYVCVYMCIYGKTQTGLLYMKNLNVCFFFVPHLRTDFFELHTEEIFSFFPSFFSLSTALPWYAFGFYYCSQLWQYKCNNSAFFLANNEANFFFMASGGKSMFLPITLFFFFNFFCFFWKSWGKLYQKRDLFYLRVRTYASCLDSSCPRTRFAIQRLIS